MLRFKLNGIKKEFNMKKGIQIKYDSLFELKCKLASKAGFSCIAVNFYNMVDKTEDEWKKNIDNIGEILSACKLECHQAHTY